MERKLDQPALIADDLSADGKHGDFAARFAAEGIEALSEYLAKWAAFRDLAGDDE